MILDRTSQKLELTSELESLAQIESFVDDLCEHYAVSEDEYGNILIAITEAVNNAITHGNQMNPEKKVVLNVDGDSKGMEFIVEDEGPGFDVNTVPDPTLPENLEKIRGRGIFLMRNLADEVLFENNGTKIKLIFSIPAI
ncbi:MAG: ATP-binding protein [Flavobacteriales bacterium]|nr:ATP-binding protein [Flavobacteriales bacterium]